MLGEEGNFIKFITDLLKNNLTSALALPGELQRTIKKVQRGELEVRISGTAERNRVMYVLGQQFLYTIFVYYPAYYLPYFYLSIS